MNGANCSHPRTTEDRERESAELGEILHNTLGEGRFIHVGTPLDWMKQPLFLSKQPALSILSAVPR